MMQGEELFLLYLAAGCLFILSIRGLASPQTARSGNVLGIIGMALSVGATVWFLPLFHYGAVLAAICAGGIVGTISALKVKMTALPQMIAAFNGLGGLASALIGLAEILQATPYGFEASVGLVVGGLAFSGSLVAFAKLQGRLSSFGQFRYQNVFNGLITLALIGLWAVFLNGEGLVAAVWLLLVTLIWGAAVTLPVGGADMPIVIAILNACSGWAAAGIGFSLANTVLIMTGAIVGASGTILALIMTKAMNRSFREVLFKGGQAAGQSVITGQKSAKAGDPRDAAFILENAAKVIIVPGFGMAAAQAQYAVQAMAAILRDKYGVEVKFAIHPVAGRMPGHMNVLLAEADVSYDDVFELEDINREFATADAAYVIGANDITNPAAKTDKSSPLYGMPVLDVKKAKTVFFVKRSLNPGYSGADNPLFYADNTIMLYGDAKVVTEEVVQALEQS